MMSNSVTNTNTQSNMAKRMMTITMDNILHAEKTERQMRLELNDENIIYKIYDRNKQMRVMYDTINNTPSGTCVAESYTHYIRMMEKGYQPQIYRAQFYNSALNKWCFHQYLTIRINGKLYNEKYSNGLHRRVPFKRWKNCQDGIRNVQKLRVEITYQ
jgi:hypothetical protein